MSRKIIILFFSIITLSLCLLSLYPVLAGRWLAEEKQEEYTSGGDLYTNGTLLKKKGEKTIYYIHQGKKLRVPHSVLQSSLKNKQIIEVPFAQFLDDYEYGGVLTHRMGTLVQEKGSTTIYKINRNIEKQAIPSYKIFKELGYKIENVQVVPRNEMSYYKTGKDVTTTSYHTDGDLVSYQGSVFLVQDKALYHIPNPYVFKAYGFSWNQVIPINSSELNYYKYFSTLPWPDGTLIHQKNSKAIYIIENNQKRIFETEELFINLGYQFKYIIDLPLNEFKKIPLGKNMGFKNK